MKILICSDGSEQAEQAVKLGSTIATGCQAEVTLLGIVESPGENNALLDSLKRGQSLLADKKICAELITKAGEPIAEIIKRTQETPYDLVVIGAVRKAARGAFWMSSKSYKIIKALKPPVLSVAGNTGPLKRILICSGGKPYIDNAVELTGRIASGTGASVTLLHVMPETPAIYASLARMDLSLENLLRSNSELGINLAREKQALETIGVPAEVRLRGGSVLDQILREARTGDYDLVVTGSAPSRFFQTYILGDVTREIVNRVPRAVLVVRSRWPAHQTPAPGVWWWARPAPEKMKG